MLDTLFARDQPLTEANTQHEPTCFSDANKQHHWRAAMTEELNALIKNGTWSLCSL